MTTAFVLSGGGAKGAFQVGVLKYLYKEQGLRPDIICGTSVGALNAAKLAEGHQDSDQAFDELEAIWRGITSERDIFLPNPAIEAGLDAVRGAVEEELVEAALAATGAAAAGGVLGTVLSIFLGPLGAALGGAVSSGAAFGAVVASFGDFEDEIKAAIKQAFGGIDSLNVLTPLRQLVTQRLDRSAVANSGIELRLSAVDLNSGGLFYVDQQGRSIPDSRNGPTLERLNTVKSRMLALDRSNGFVNELIDRVLADALNPGDIGLVNGVVASSAIPMIFDPVRSGARLLVDGGVREILPLHVAVELGATDIVAVQASSGRVGQGLPAEGLGADFQIVAMIERTFDIFANEVSRDDERVDVPGGVNVELIKPAIDIQDVLEFIPEIIALNIFVGFDTAKAHFEGTDPLPKEILELLRRLALLKARLRRFLGISLPGLNIFGYPAGSLVTSIPTLQIQVQQLTQQLTSAGAPPVPGLYTPANLTTIVPSKPRPTTTTVGN